MNSYSTELSELEQSVDIIQHDAQEIEFEPLPVGEDAQVFLDAMDWLKALVWLAFLNAKMPKFE